MKLKLAGFEKAERHALLSGNPPHSDGLMHFAISHLKSEAVVELIKIANTGDINFTNEEKYRFVSGAINAGVDIELFRKIIENFNFTKADQRFWQHIQRELNSIYLAELIDHNRSDLIPIALNADTSANSKNAALYALLSGKLECLAELLDWIPKFDFKTNRILKSLYCYPIIRLFNKNKEEFNIDKLDQGAKLLVNHVDMESDDPKADIKSNLHEMYSEVIIPYATDIDKLPSVQLSQAFFRQLLIFALEKFPKDYACFLTNYDQNKAPTYAWLIYVCKHHLDHEESSLALPFVKAWLL